MNFWEFKKMYQKKEVEEFANQVFPEPMVSICVQTYQHVNYIKECLDGILMQKTSFPFEILLGDDESTDGTREVCVEYTEKYPEKIRFFLHSRENNIRINGNPTGRFNLLYNLYSANGRYIALCEGDDYWTDPLKLQKQVNFLEENPEFNICFHQVKILNSQTFTDDVHIEKRYNSITEFPATVLDLLKAGNFIHTPSVMYRGDEIKIPFEFTLSPVGDYFLHIIVAQEGYIKRIDEVMAVYRHGVGIYSTLSSREMQKKITLYQLCILSYLHNTEQKKIFLNKVLNTVNKLQLENDENRRQIRSLKQLSRILFQEICKRWKRKFL